MKGCLVFVGCVVVLVLMVCGGVGVFVGLYFYIVVVFLSVFVVGMLVLLSVLVSVMGLEQVVVVELVVGKVIWDKVKEDGGLIFKEVVNVFFYLNFDDNVDVIVYVVLIKVGFMGIVLIFWFILNIIDYVMGLVFFEDFLFFVDIVGGVKYGVNYFFKVGDMLKFVVGSEELEIDVKSVYVMQVLYLFLLKLVMKVKIVIGLVKMLFDILVIC